jgi:hypothetical protein
VSYFYVAENSCIFLVMSYFPCMSLIWALILSNTLFYFLLVINILSLVNTVSNLSVNNSLEHLFYPRLYNYKIDTNTKVKESHNFLSHLWEAKGSVQDGVIILCLVYHKLFPQIHWTNWGIRSSFFFFLTHAFI